MNTTNYLVLHSYKPKKEGEITLNIGDLVFITKDLKKGLCYGKNLGNNKNGIFPRRIVEQYDENWVMNVPLSQSILKGSLTKRRSKFQSWKKRYIQLYPRSLSWSKKINTEPIGLVLLKDCRKLVKIKHRKKTKHPLFFLQSQKKSWEFKCKSESDREVWVSTLMKQIKTLTNIANNSIPQRFIMGAKIGFEKNRMAEKNKKEKE
ncbi:dual adapter for phosphotyrosine and 3-phosphotyrosine and 3-phosphoinositide [Anaeramoeba flamelloides]|uniref:Dual adapter for phosphotyrosine and 3-phosphotyrosine and 3-phosphoinositide n=1 Tax=Anaeramoeba flamelloides TaxID=1746091 RepID=A0ABQ8XL53_9EUKA|nr:dual adapter for phosphotyrosine and 3-phosphotyrosine and 3-phosphoinositide [Anaeramoeba flamelloides]